MPHRFIIHAPNVHYGGGKSLLAAVLASLPESISSVVIVDERLDFEFSNIKNIQVQRVQATIRGRLIAEKWLAENTSADDTVLSFGNLPPLFKLSGRVLVFLQNRYLAENADLSGFSLRTSFRLKLERLWFWSRINRVEEVIVQTSAMRRLLVARIHDRVKVSIFPFLPGERHGGVDESRRPIGEPGYDFIYLASGEPHKNHHRLVEAWCLLAQEQVFPSLALTLDEAVYPELCQWIRQQIDRFGLKLDFVLNFESRWADMLRADTGALIYPSTLESFGLPLIDARESALPVVASELDYVRDLLDPEQTFDPQSSLSIARAVKRYLGRSEPLSPVHSAADFVKYILREV